MSPRQSWHTPGYLRRRRRRLVLRGLLYVLALTTAYEVHLHDAIVYAHDRGSQDPVAAVVFLVLAVLATFATTDSR